MKERIEQKLEKRIELILNKNVENITYKECEELKNKLNAIDYKEHQEERQKDMVELMTKVFNR